MAFRPDTLSYSFSLKQYIETKGLPKEFFVEPDYIYHTASSTQEFGQIVEDLDSDSGEVILQEVNEQLMAIARLSGRLLVPNFGYVNWASVKEPTLEEAALSFNGLRSVAFYHPDAQEVAQVLSWRGVPHTVEEIEDDYTIDATYAYSGYGFRINTSRLSDTELQQDLF